MKKHVLQLLQTKWLYVIVFLMFLVPFVLLLNVGQTGELHHTLLMVDRWMKSKRILFLLWHILIIAAIYYGWGIKVDKATRQANLPKEEVQNLKRFRYLMMLFVFIVGLLAGLYRI